MEQKHTLWFSDLLTLLSQFAEPTGNAAQDFLPLEYATMPFLGFRDPQRMPASPEWPYSSVATWMNTGIGHQGREWLVPLLTPNQDRDDVRTLLEGRRLEKDQEERMYQRAWDFAQKYERAHPGTFAKYPTSIEAQAAAMGASKNLMYKFPPVPPSYPGR